MNRSTLLSATDDLSVSRFDHPPGEVHSDPDHEVADHWGVAFVERGSFDLRCEGRRVPLRAGGVLLTRPGLEFNCHHGQHCPDDVCLAVRFEDTALAGLRDPWFQQGRLVRRVSSPRLALVHQRLAHAGGFRRVRGQVADVTRGSHLEDGERDRGLLRCR